MAGVSFLLFPDFGKSHSRIIDKILDFGHLPLFGVVSLAILWILNYGKWPCTITKRYLQAGIISVFLAVLTECIQIFMPNRYFQLGDILNDTIGAAVFLWLAYSFFNNLPVLAKVLSRWVAILLMILPVIPIFVAVFDTWNMERNFPVLSSFESFFEMSRWTQKESMVHRSTIHASEGGHSLEVALLPGSYPGISMDYLANDWRGYESLSFDVFLEGPLQLSITIRINDRAHNNEFTDRFNKRLQIFPGENHISINLDEVRTAPKGRVMNMAEITNISIFTYKLKEQRTVYFDNFMLKGHN
jgi:VanZ family protein